MAQLPGVQLRYSYFVGESCFSGLVLTWNLHLKVSLEEVHNEAFLRVHHEPTPSRA